MIVDFLVDNSEEEIVLDPVTGNPVLSQTLYRVGIHIKGIPSILQEPGSNPNIVQVEGRVVETWNNILEQWENLKVLPETILRYQSEANAKYIDAVSGLEQPAYFTVTPDIDSRRPRVAKRVSRRIGSTIKGNLRF